MSEHPDQEGRNIREINDTVDPSDNETQRETDAREARQSDTPSLRERAVFDLMQKELTVVTAERDKLLQDMQGPWSSDKPLPEDAEIMAVHPAETEGHDKTFSEALRMVGAKHSKYGLVNLVNWLLVKGEEQQREIARLKEERDEARRKATALNGARNQMANAFNASDAKAFWEADRRCNYLVEEWTPILAMALADRDALAAKLAEAQVKIDWLTAQHADAVRICDSNEARRLAAERKLAEAQTACNEWASRAGIAETSLAEAQKDTERLDWLWSKIKNGQYPIGVGAGSLWKLWTTEGGVR